MVASSKQASVLTVVGIVPNDLIINAEACFRDSTE